jgi:hypothetical protein
MPIPCKGHKNVGYQQKNNSSHKFATFNRKKYHSSISIQRDYIPVKKLDVFLGYFVVQSIIEVLYGFDLRHARCSKQEEPLLAGKTENKDSARLSSAYEVSENSINL